MVRSLYRHIRCIAGFRHGKGVVRVFPWTLILKTTFRFTHGFVLSRRVGSGCLCQGFLPSGSGIRGSISPVSLSHALSLPGGFRV